MSLAFRVASCRLAGFLIVSLFAASVARAEAPRALPQGQLPDDARLGELRSLNSYHPFHPVASPEAWKERKAELRRQIAVAAGLWPQPTRTPLKAVIHGRIERPGYTIEKVYFQSMPGHFVTGNLYRPENAEGKLPAVLCPHGHWPDGRFMDAGKGKGEQSAAVRKQLATGAERFVSAARSPLQARCVQLARMGCVVFHYDMVGYADSIQLEHRCPPREQLMGKELGTWGFASPRAHGWLQSNFGLQCWNSIRALDFLLSLDGIDPERVAVTGASGGGTQTMMLAALDDRITLAFPAVMVSTAMQGGCTCENCCYLRIGAGNIDIAACAAPRPLGVTSANDWTREMPSKGYPDLQALYKLLGHPERLTGAFLPQFPHNYNHVSRTAMYTFVNKQFKLGLPSPVLEHDFPFAAKEQLTVWDDAHLAPAGSQRGDEHEKALLRWWAEDARRQLDELVPKSGEDLARYREVVGGAVDALLGRDLPEASQIEFELTDKQPRDGYLQMTGLVRYKPAGEELPAVFLYPENWNRRVVLWITSTGKNGLFNEKGEPKPEVARLLKAGASVVGVDLLYQGEFLQKGKTPAEARQVKNNWPDAAWSHNVIYTYGYNSPLFAKRVHDVLTMISFVRDHERAPKSLAVVGIDAPWVAAACAQAGEAVDRIALDTAGFRFAKLDSALDPDFLPGMVKYGDLPALIALAAPQKLWIAGESKAALEPVQAVYRAAGAEENLVRHGGRENIRGAAVDWLLTP